MVYCDNERHEIKKKFSKYGQSGIWDAIRRAKKNTLNNSCAVYKTELKGALDRRSNRDSERCDYMWAVYDITKVIARDRTDKLFNSFDDYVTQQEQAWISAPYDHKVQIENNVLERMKAECTSDSVQYNKLYDTAKQLIDSQGRLLKQKIPFETAYCEKEVSILQVVLDPQDPFGVFREVKEKQLERLKTEFETKLRAEQEDRAKKTNNQNRILFMRRVYDNRCSLARSLQNELLTKFCGVVTTENSKAANKREASRKELLALMQKQCKSDATKFFERFVDAQVQLDVKQSRVDELMDKVKTGVGEISSILPDNPFKVEWNGQIHTQTRQRLEEERIYDQNGVTSDVSSNIPQSGKSSLTRKLTTQSLPTKSSSPKVQMDPRRANTLPNSTPQLHMNKPLAVKPGGAKSLEQTRSTKVRQS